MLKLAGWTRSDSEVRSLIGVQNLRPRGENMLLSLSDKLVCFVGVRGEKQLLAGWPLYC